VLLIAQSPDSYRMIDPLSSRKAFLSSCWLVGAFCMHTTLAEGRQWYRLSIDGDRVGYAWHDRVLQAGQYIDSEVTKVEVEELRKQLTVEMRTEVMRTAAGVAKEIHVESLIGAERNGWVGRLDPDGHAVNVSVAGASGAQTYLTVSGLILPDTLHAALMPLWQEGHPNIELIYLEPTAAKPTQLRAELIASPSISEPQIVQIRTTETSGHSTRREILWFDTHGELRHLERQFFGATLIWDLCLRDCDAPIDRPFDLMAKLVVQSPYRVPRTAFAGPIRYVLTRIDGTPPRLPATGEQSVVTDDTRTIVTICSTCGAAEALAEADRKRYLQPNAWVQSDSRDIRRFADHHGAGKTPQEIMSHLVDAVRDHMTGPVEYLGYASAAEALRTRSGDCTEYAVLLAALARAQNIPARVAYGLVYADRFSGKKDVFSPHAWVQAWTGRRWQSYDAGIGEFDATHLALSIGSGDPRDIQNAAGAPAELRIEKLGLVK
jgi:Transglutaminase-like superfamily